MSSEDLLRALAAALPQWAAEEPEGDVADAVAWVRARTLRGGRLRPRSVRPSAWALLGAFFGVAERFADAPVWTLRDWPGEAQLVFGPRTRVAAGLPPRTPAELFAAELAALGPLPAAEVRAFDVAAEDEAEEAHRPLPLGVVVGRVDGGGGWDAERAAALGEALRPAARPGVRLGLPRGVDPEVAARFGGAVSRYLVRSAY